MADFLRDLRYAFRTLTRQAGVTTVVILTMALAIGANTAIFTVANAVLLRPLPYEDPERLVSVQRYAEQFGKNEWLTVSKFVLYRDGNDVLENLAAYRGIPVGYNLTAVAEPEQVSGIRVSVELFPMLGVRPTIGRHFDAEEGRRGSEPVVIINDGLWRKRFGADPGILGAILELSDRAHTIVGVMPPDFRFTPDVDLWTPMQPVIEASDQGHIIKLPRPFEARAYPRGRERESRATGGVVERRIPGAPR